MDVRENTVEFVERVVGDDELALAALPRVLDHDLRTQSVGQARLEFTDVRVLARATLETCATLVLFRRIDQPANQCLGFTDR